MEQAGNHFVARHLVDVPGVRVVMGSIQSALSYLKEGV